MKGALLPLSQTEEDSTTEKRYNQKPILDTHKLQTYAISAICIGGFSEFYHPDHFFWATRF